MFRSAPLFIGTSFTVTVFTIFATSNVDSIVGIPHKYIFNAKNLNQHKKPISLLPICIQRMQRAWWLEAGTIIVTGPYCCHFQKSGQIQQYIYIYMYIYSFFILSPTATSFVMRSPVYPCMESVIPTLKDIRAAIARASLQLARAPWISDQWLDRESVRLELRCSKNTPWSRWIKLLRLYVLEHQQMWYERHHSTQIDRSFLPMHNTQVDLLLALNSSMIRMRKLFVAHPPRDLDRVCYLTLAVLGT